MLSHEALVLLLFPIPMRPIVLAFLPWIKSEVTVGPFSSCFYSLLDYTVLYPVPFRPSLGNQVFQDYVCPCCFCKDDERREKKRKKKGPGNIQSSPHGLQLSSTPFKPAIPLSSSPGSPIHLILTRYYVNTIDGTLTGHATFYFAYFRLFSLLFRAPRLTPSIRCK